MDFCGNPDIAEKAGSVRRNLAPVMEAVAKAPHDVRIVGITKYVDAAWCCAAVDAGLTELGENRILEGAEKFGAVRATGRVFTAHLVGPIQSNKARKVPGAFDFIQALDSLKAAQLLDKRCGELGIRLDALVEVNIDREPQKAGVMPEDASGFLAEVWEKCPALSLRGIMAIPPAPEFVGELAYESTARASFARTRRLFEELRHGKPGMDTLSMGMSADYTWAIEEGATMLRVGRMLWKP